MQIPLELKKIDQSILSDMMQPTNNNNNTATKNEYIDIMNRQDELYKTRLELMENPDNHNSITDPNIKLSIRMKIRTLNSHIRHNIDVDKNTILRDKYMSLLPPIDINEIKYYIMHTFLSEDIDLNMNINKGVDLFENITSKSISSFVDVNTMLKDKIINFFKDCCDTKQYNNFDESTILGQITEVKRELNI